MKSLLKRTQELKLYCTKILQLLLMTYISNWIKKNLDITQTSKLINDIQNGSRCITSAKAGSEKSIIA